MKLLLDEQMPRKIYRLFPSDYVVSNVQAEGWAGVQNGELLDLAHAKGFDALIAADKKHFVSAEPLNSPNFSSCAIRSAPKN